MALDEKNTWNHTWTQWIMLARNLGEFFEANLFEVGG